jgi:hypothetical protein
MIIEKKKIFLGMTAAFIMITMLPVFTYAQTTSDGHTDHVHAPVVATASDGHTDHTHAAGGSDLLKPWTPRWFGLLGVATLLTLGLSLGVWRYLQVEPIKKTVPSAVEPKK